MREAGHIRLQLRDPDILTVVAEDLADPGQRKVVLEGDLLDRPAGGTLLDDELIAGVHGSNPRRYAYNRFRIALWFAKSASARIWSTSPACQSAAVNSVAGTASHSRAHNSLVAGSTGNEMRFTVLRRLSVISHLPATA
jgi:hypothetical protein